MQVASRSDPSVSLAVLACLSRPLETDAIGWLSNLTAATLTIPAIPTTIDSPLGLLRWRGLTTLYEIVTPETIGFLDRSVASALLDWLAAQDDEDEDEEHEAVDERRSIDARRELLLRHVASFTLR